MIEDARMQLLLERKLAKYLPCCMRKWGGASSQLYAKRYLPPVGAGGKIPETYVSTSGTLLCSLCTFLGQ